MEFIEGEPPPREPLPRVHKHRGIYDTLREHPGQWAIIGEYDVTSRTQRGNPGPCQSLRNMGLQVKTRSIRNGAVVVLYARYVEP